MRILILGGTKFLGRHVVDAALARNHEVTLFNRGKTNPAVFPEVKTLQGDRDGNLAALKHGTWDIVIDTSGYVPRVVRQSAELLQDRAGSYLFVSSLSVYQDFSQIGIGEDGPVGQVDDPTTEDVLAWYGPLKALCENEVKGLYGERTLIIRPGLIVGPHDPTDRFTYWVRRFSEGGPVLVPGRHDRPVQFIDARDLAEWMIRLAERQVRGVFNATGPLQPLTMSGLVEALETLPTPGHAVWVSEEFLLSHGVKEWSELPLWISESTNWPGFSAVDINQAIGQGLVCRPIEDTIHATYTWDRSRPLGDLLGAGLDRSTEEQLLRQWRGPSTPQ